MATLTELKNMRTQDNKFVPNKTYYSYESYGVGYDEVEYTVPFHIIRRTEKSIWFWIYDKNCVEMKRIITYPNGKEAFKHGNEYHSIEYMLEVEIPHTIGGKKI